MTFLSIWLFVKPCIVTGRSSLNNGGFDYAQPPGRWLSVVEGSEAEGSVVEGSEVEG